MEQIPVRKEWGKKGNSVHTRDRQNMILELWQGRFRKSVPKNVEQGNLQMSTECEEGSKTEEE